MGKKPSGNGSFPAPINLEQARAELIRAEELLKQRHANTRLVLQKQKEITAQLKEANALVASLERRMKEEVRQKEKLKAENLKKDAVIADLRLELRKLSAQANSQSVSHPQTPSDEDIRSVLSERVQGQLQRLERSEQLERTERSLVSQKPLTYQKPERPGLSVDSRNAAPRGAKRKVREEVGLDKREMLADMLDFILDGAEPGCSLAVRVNKATDGYMEEFPCGQDTWAGEVAMAAFDVLLNTCVLREVACRWADMVWSPSRWFDPSRSKETSEAEPVEVRCRSLVATWCDPQKLQTDFIPWMLACLRRLEEKSRQRVTYELLDTCITEVLRRCLGTDENSLPDLCCATTVAIVLCKMTGRRGLELGMTLLVDIIGRCGPRAQNGIVALAAALEVWPELGVILKNSTFDVNDIIDTQQRQNDVYTMASLALQRTLHAM